MNIHHAKKQLFSLLIIVTIFLSVLLINSNQPVPQNTLVQANDNTTSALMLPSKPEFLLRSEWINAFSTPNDVEAFVEAHPWGTGIMLTDYSSGILSILSYTGWKPNQTWFGQYGGPTHTQLKSVIDEFHRLGWKVVYSAGNTPQTNDNYIYQYLTEQHPELIAVSGDGKRYDQLHPGTVMVNFFAQYATDDAARNITAGQRLVDLYTQRFSQMISDGNLQWDGWFGVDGWNGFTVQEMYWVWSTNQPFGRWIGTSNPAQWYYGDEASIDEWSASMSDLPSNWNDYTCTQKIRLIQGSYNLQWWNYWQDRFAQMYGQINAVFNQRPQEFRVGSIISQDLSSTWADNGINNPVGMENLAAFEKYNSFSLYYIDMEWAGEPSMCGRYAAYVAGLVKTKMPSAHCVVGLPIQWNWGEVTPVWVWKQMYLSMAQSFVWNNGVRYRAVDPNYIIAFVPGGTNGVNGWDDAKFHGQEMANWVQSTANVLGAATPVWLGPTEVLPLYLGSVGAFSVNYTFAQFADSYDLNRSAAFVSGMNAVFLDAVIDYGNAMSPAALQNLVNLYSNNRLNVVYYTYGFNSAVPNLFQGYGKEEFAGAFRVTQPGNGASTQTATLSSSQVTDPYGRYILGSTFGQTYFVSTGDTGNAVANPGLIPLITYTDGYLQLGITYGETTGRFVYGKAWSGQGWTPTTIVDREVLNRALLWASNCPIAASDPLADLKIFSLPNGDMAITVMNLRDSHLDLPFTLNLTGLGLDAQATYKATWIASGETVCISDLNSVAVTLKGGTDILIVTKQ